MPFASTDPYNTDPSPNQPERNILILEDESLKHGFIQLPKIILRARNLSRDAKLLYSILLSYAWGDDHCFPGYQRLCFDMQGSENMVRKYMRELESVGLLSQKRRGLGKTNLYVMHEIRTSKIEVLDLTKSEVAEHAKSEVNVYTRKQETELQTTYLRKKQSLRAKAAGGSVTPDPSPPPPDHAAASHPSPPGGPRAVGREAQPLAGLLASRAPRRTSAREDKLAIGVAIEKFTAQLGDATPQSSKTRAMNLYHRSGLGRDGFIDLLFRAAATTRQKRRSMGYFFGVLEKQLAPEAAATEEPTLDNLLPDR